MRPSVRSVIGLQTELTVAQTSLTNDYKLGAWKHESIATPPFFQVYLEHFPSKGEHDNISKAAVGCKHQQEQVWRREIVQSVSGEGSCRGERLEKCASAEQRMSEMSQGISCPGIQM